MNDAVLPAHSALGASAASRWLNCPGSVKLSQSVPPAPTSIYAATGTLAHMFIERGLKPPIKRMEHGQIGLGYTIEGHDITVDEDLVDGVNVMLDYVKQRRVDFDELHTEMTVHLDGYFTPPPPVRMFGRTDVVLISRREVEIVDYKNGSGVIVEPENNPQTLYYAAGVIAWLRRRVPPYLPAKVKTTIVQPHARSVAKVRSATLDVVDLMMWVDEVLVPGVAACSVPDAPLVPGSWCRFCPVSSSCPALISEANRMAKLEFNDEGLKLDDPTEMSRLLDVATRARAWCDALEAVALDQLKRQVRIPGWTLAPTRPTRKWSDERAAGDQLHALGVVDAWRTDLKTPAQIEKLVRKQLSNRAWDEQLSPLVESVSSGVKLARDDAAPFEDFTC